MRFVVYTPDYRHNSAGIRVMHRLVELLNDIDEEAYGITRELGEYNVPFTDKVYSDDIVIYPEVVLGNPLNGNNVVRYVLNKPGLIGGDKRYNKNDMVFYYNDELLSDARSATTKKLSIRNRVDISVIEPHLFYYNNFMPLDKRNYNCVYIGKGTFEPSPEIMDAIEITRIYPSTRQDTAVLLRSCHTLYTFDDFSAIIRESLICGCNVMIWSGEQWIKYDEDVSKYKEYYYQWSKEDVKEMVSIIKEEINGRKR